MLTNFQNDYFWVGISSILTRNKYTYSSIVSACNPGSGRAKVFKFESGEELIKWMSK